MNIDENWTDDPPEAGNAYWLIHWLPNYNEYSKVSIMPAGGFYTGLWDDRCYDHEHPPLRSIHPIPDPTPPPLPKGKV